MSTCEIPSPAGPAPTPAGSRILYFRPAVAGAAPHSWQGAAAADYKPPAAHHGGVLRTVLVGGQGEKTAFQLRYFEVGPGGFTTLERHAHAHAVMVLRGRGEVRLGGAAYPVSFGDTVYVAPHEVHQFRNPSASEPLGFLCVVDADRDRPVPVEGG
jgi:quercetin dioxygenase-like cupin family protein